MNLPKLSMANYLFIFCPPPRSRNVEKRNRKQATNTQVNALSVCKSTISYFRCIRSILASTLQLNPTYNPDKRKPTQCTIRVY